MVFTIDGLDIVPFIAEDGVDWTANGVDGPDTGRVMNAKMYRGLITHKARADVSCFWLKKADVVLLYNKLMKEYFTVVTDTVPWINGTVTMEMYSNNAKIKLSTEYTDGTKLYSDLQFPLIER